MRAYSQRARRQGKTIGFVPTMGYLHEGHLSLVRSSKKECDVTIVSIFVNPAQFGPKEDFKNYPRDMRKDKKLLKKEKPDVIFAPSRGEMYPDKFDTYVEVGGSVTKTLCAVSRANHFKGVATVVAKLFNIIMPDKAYFGQKDAQQTIVIKKMLCDLNMNVILRVMPIIREKDGLARSSRNIYLSQTQRKEAVLLFKSLKIAQELIKHGAREAAYIKQEMKKILKKGKDIKIDYIEIAGGEDLNPLKKVKDNTLIALACFVGKTRLIDNVVIDKVNGDI